MSGSTIGGVVGGVIGFWVGGPQGAYYGWMIGSAVGGYVDPVQIQGPRLQDLRGQTSAVGGAIPRAFGTAPVPCNIIWRADAIEHESTDSGKGSGTEQVTYTYTRSYAVMFHLGEIAGVLQVKRNGKIVYDARDDATMLAEYEAAMGPLASVSEWTNRMRIQRAINARFINKCEFYLGTQTQDPDPTIESYLGVGNVSAYRGRAYMVVTDDDVTNEAGAIPQYEVIVAACGTVNEVEGWSEHPVNWMIQSEVDGRLYTATDPNVWNQSSLSNGHVSYVTTVGDRIVISNRISGSVDAYYSDDFAQSWSVLPNWPAADVAPPLVLPSGRVVVLAVHATNATVHYSDDNLVTWNSVPLGTGGHHIAGDDRCIIVTNLGTRLVSTNRGQTFGAPIANGFTCTSIGHSEGLFVLGAASGVAFRWSDDQGQTLNLCTGTFIPAGQSISMVPMSDGSWITAVSGSGVQTTGNIFRSEDGKTGWASVTTPSMYFGGGTEAGRIAERGGVVIAAGHNATALLQIIKSDDNGENWSAVTHGYSGFVVHAGTGVAAFPLLPGQSQSIPDAPGFYTTPDGEIIYPGYETLTPCSTTTIGEIVAEACQLSGLEPDEYDVSELTDTLIGYVVARETDGASIIDSLRPVGMFDLTEEDGVIRFVKRGGVAAGSINDDDLVERDGDSYERELVQEPELLRSVTTGYIDPDAGFSPNTQKWERRSATVRARGESLFEVSAVMDADQAVTTSKRRVFTSWGEPEKQKLSLPYRLTRYVPTDILNYTDSAGEVHTIRFMQVSDDSGVRLIESSTNCAEAYSTVASGVAPNPPSVTDPGLYGPTIFVAMNLDSLRPQDNVPGMYLAATGVLAGWTGCIVELSTDGGVSFRQILEITTPATIGFLTDAVELPDSNTDGGPLNVFLYAGADLSSVTPAQIADGANAAAIISDDVGEIIQFETATQTSTGYSLTDLTRGVNDSEPAEHIYGDHFVLLNANVIFVPIDTVFSGQTLIFRASAFGTQQDSAVEVSVVYEPPTFVIDGGGA